MPLDGAIDLHANHRVVVFHNEQDQVIDHRRFTNDSAGATVASWTRASSNGRKGAIAPVHGGSRHTDPVNHGAWHRRDLI
jgi:hypothetical protein